MPMRDSAAGRHPEPHTPSSPSTSRQHDAQSPSLPTQQLRDPLSDVDVASSFDPYPSPALSAYSYTTSSSVDLSDFDSDLGSLSLDALDEPVRSHQRHLTVTTDGLPANGDAQSQRKQHLQQARRPHSPPDDDQDGDYAGRVCDLSGERHLSGTSTPIATASSHFLAHGNGSMTSTKEHPYAHLRLSPKQMPGLDYNGTAPAAAQASATLTSPAGPAVGDAAAEAQGAGDDADAEDDAADDEGMDNEGDELDAFDFEDVNEDDMHAEGIPAARGFRLDARQADTPKFLQKVLDLLSIHLKLAGWSAETVDPSLRPLVAQNLKLKRISGAFTNAVFFASYRLAPSQQPPAPTASLPPTVLLRVYGTGSEALLSRRAELLILHTLSSLYEIGPHILGTFANGRVEEFYECEPIQKEGMRDLGDREARIVAGDKLKIKGREGRAHWVARRMNELHAVPLEVMRTVLEQGDLKAPGEKGFGRGIQDHIMASSHRPRRKLRHKPSHSTGMASGLAASSPMIYGLDGRRSVRASPAPMGPNELPPGPDPELAHGRGGYYSHHNSSVASLDSLATSYDSQSSMSSFSPSLHGYGSPRVGPASASATGAGSQSSSTYFPPVAGAPRSSTSTSVEHGSGKGRSSSLGSSARGPYPGVWRRMKRWSREAAKVVQLVESFARSESGSKAIAIAFEGHPSIKEEIVAGADGKGGLSTDTIGPTPGSLRNTLRCMRALDLASMVKELDEFKHFVRTWERREGPSKRVFAHNDAQYGNLLEIKSSAHGGANAAGTGNGHGGAGIDPGDRGGARDGGAGGPTELSLESPAIPAGMPRHHIAHPAASSSSSSSMDRQRGSVDSNATASPPVRATQRAASRSRARKPPPPHHKLVVIDFEYACPNPRAYDIANHFQEWRADYHHPTMSWSLRHHGAYPDEHQRRKWLRAYVEQGRLVRMRGRAIGLDNLPAPTEMALPPSVVSVPAPRGGSAASSTPASAATSTSSLVSGDSGYGAGRDDGTSNKQDTRASQFGALEKSLGGSGKAPGPGARTPSAHSLRSGTAATTPATETDVPPMAVAAVAAAPMTPAMTVTERAPKERRLSTESVSSSSWQAGSLAATPLGALDGVSSPAVDVPQSPQMLALARLDASIEKEVDRLDREVRVWSPATHAVWGLWGIVFAKEEVESVLARAIAEVESTGTGTVVRDAATTSVLRSAAQGQDEQGGQLHEAGSAESFDNLRYALGRFELFRAEFGDLKRLGLDRI